MYSEFRESRNLKVLAADISSVDSELISIFIRSHCRQIVRERNGISVVDLVHKSISDGMPFDLIFLNVNLVGIDGIESTQRIREVGFDGCIVGMSVNNGHELREEWSAVGCNEFLEKPVSSINVRKIIQRVSIGPK